MKYQQNGFVMKPPAVYIENNSGGGKVCYLRKNIVQVGDGWDCTVVQFDAAPDLTLEAATARFDELWATHEPEDTDSLLTDMYEQLVSMQGAQAATDAALCDIYESLAGGA